jgi:hypothetical protein
MLSLKSLQAKTNYFDLGTNWSMGLKPNDLKLVRVKCVCQRKPWPQLASVNSSGAKKWKSKKLVYESWFVLKLLGCDLDGCIFSFLNICGKYFLNHDLMMPVFNVRQ